MEKGRFETKRGAFEGRSDGLGAVPAEDARSKGMREGGVMRWRHGDSPGNFVSQEGREARKAFSIISSFR